VGIEDTEDLIADLRRALDGSRVRQGPPRKAAGEIMR